MLGGRPTAQDLELRSLCLDPVTFNIQSFKQFPRQVQEYRSFHVSNDLDATPDMDVQITMVGFWKSNIRITVLLEAKREPSRGFKKGREGIAN